MFWNKQNQLLLGPVIVLTVFLSTPLWAGDIIRYEYAKVLDVTPVIEVVQVPRDERICQQEMVRRRVPEHRSPAPAICGSILGGVIGSQFGGGSGKTAATIGGAVATHAQYRRYPPRYYDATQQVCRMERSWGSEERVVAWDVSWKYRGEVYQSRMHEPPGDRIPVRVSVSPVYD